MDTLNDDCLREIIAYLSLPDQVSLLQVNSALQAAVSSYWISKYRNGEIYFLRTDMNSRDWEIFLETIKDSIEQLAIRFMNQRRFAILKRYVFPHCRNLRLTTHPCFIEDDDLLDFHRSFPNLTAFSPHGNLSGRYFDLWPQLCDIKLSYCFRLQLRHFHHILRTLPLEVLDLNIFPISKQYEQLDLRGARLQQLKELHCNTYELYYFLGQPLPALKELTLANEYNTRQIFDVLLATWQATHIRRMETASVESVLANCLEMRMNIPEIWIIHDNNPLPYDALPSLTQLTNLRVLRLRSCDFGYMALQDLLRAVPQLDLVSLEECRMGKDVIELDARQIAIERKKTLRLNFWHNMNDGKGERAAMQHTEDKYVVVRVRNPHSFFQVTLDRLSSISYHPMRLLFH